MTMDGQDNLEDKLKEEWELKLPFLSYTEGLGTPFGTCRSNIMRYYVITYLL